ncbi:MAG: hypothetical protein ABI648_01435 [Betaproteobacteria bacterium]
MVGLDNAPAGITTWVPMIGEDASVTATVPPAESMTWLAITVAPDPGVVPESVALPPPPPHAANATRAAHDTMILNEVSMIFLVLNGNNGSGPDPTKHQVRLGRECPGIGINRYSRSDGSLAR